MAFAGSWAPNVQPVPELSEEPSEEALNFRKFHRPAPQASHKKRAFILGAGEGGAARRGKHFFPMSFY